MIPEEQCLETEKWAWQEIRAGRTADFNKYLGKALAPTSPDGWGDARKIGSDFLKRMLLRQPYSSEIPAEGVRIVGAWFPEAIELGHGRLTRQLWFEGCRFEEPANLDGLEIDGWFSLESSTFAEKRGDAISVRFNGAKINGHVSFASATLKGADLTNARISGQLILDDASFGAKLDMRGIYIAQDLLLKKAKLNDVDLVAAKIGGQLNLNGATFDSKLDMEGVDVTQHLLMSKEAIFKDVSLVGARISGQLSFNGATFDGAIDMSGLAIGQDLFMNKTHFNDVNLIGGKVGGQIYMSGSTFNGRINMSGLAAGQDLFMNKTHFNEVNLIGGKVGGQIDMTGATFDAKLNMNGIDVARHVFMRDKARFKEVELRNAKVGGVLDLSDATFDGSVDLESICVDGGGFMRNSTFDAKLEMIFARCGANLDISNSEFVEFDLSGTRIEGELRLGSYYHGMTRWRKGDILQLNLRNVHVGALQDKRQRVVRHSENRPRWPLFGNRKRLEKWEDAWPEQLQLDGFTYDRLGGFGGNSEVDSPDTDNNMQSRNVNWYINWLARDRSYTPQPYEQLARAFRAAGEPTKADSILYESRGRARIEAWRQRNYASWLGSSFLNWTIGYGIGTRYFRALVWVIVFTAVGTAVLYFFGHQHDGFAESGLPARIVYSLDQLLPIVEFEKYDKVVLARGAAYYFYLQKLVGWALGSFLVAGLAGLTQKQ